MCTDSVCIVLSTTLQCYCPSQPPIRHPTLRAAAEEYTSMGAEVSPPLTTTK